MDFNLHLDISYLDILIKFCIHIQNSSSNKLTWKQIIMKYIMVTNQVNLYSFGLARVATILIARYQF